MSDPPFLLVINIDLETLDRVASELERRHKPDYEVARATSAQEAATTSERLALDQRGVALILSSLKCPTAMAGKPWHSYGRGIPVHSESSSSSPATAMKT